MVGLGAPHWDAEARGIICGLGRQHTLAHLARAAIEAIAFQIADVFFTIEAATEMRFEELRADGGPTRNDSLMQFQADLLGVSIARSSNEELSAIGAAWLAGITLGWWKSVDVIEMLPAAGDRFETALNPVKRKQLYEGWKRAVDKARSGQEARA
jgi:glycerol kinase